MTDPRDTSHQRQPKPAKRLQKVEFAGVGSLVQFLGLLALLAAACFGYLMGQTLAGVVVGVVGVVGCICLIVIGSEMSKKSICGNCGNPLASKHVRLCPTCKSPIE